MIVRCILFVVPLRAQINDLKNNYSLVYGESHCTRTAQRLPVSARPRCDAVRRRCAWRRKSNPGRSPLSSAFCAHFSFCFLADMMIKNMDKVVKAQDTDNYRNMY